ncbi:hypothetical protein HUU59_11690 [bacterium]|nr:hypothetical protein [bacterium]
MRFILLCALAVWFQSCTSPTDSNEDTPQAAETRTLTVEARPNAIPADGVSTMTIFVEYHVNGEPVTDSTRVILLNPMGTLNAGTIYTFGGVALDTLTADTLAGLGWLVAYADGIRDSVEIMFTE